MILQLILLQFTAHLFADFIFQPQKDSSIHEQSLPNAGKLIGIMERFLVLALILVGQFSAAGLILAAKSVLRFRSIVKNEYILVGTFLTDLVIEELPDKICLSRSLKITGFE